jgi:hypothetical protein
MSADLGCGLGRISIVSHGRVTSHRALEHEWVIESHHVWEGLEAGKGGGF